MYKRKYDIARAVETKRWPQIWGHWLNELDPYESDLLIDAVLSYVPGLHEVSEAVRAADGCSLRAQDALAMMIYRMDDDYCRTARRQRHRRQK